MHNHIYKDLYNINLINLFSNFENIIYLILKFYILPFSNWFINKINLMYIFLNNFL